MRFVNLCKHDVVYQHVDGSDEVFEPSGTVAIVTATPGKTVEEDGYAFTHAGEPGALAGLPAPQHGVVYIASMFAAQIAWEQHGRRDVCSPGTGPADGPIRSGGNVVAVTRWKWPYQG